MIDDFLPISALRHYAYCPRRYALIHIEQEWEDNQYTVEGGILHERVDSGVHEQRKGVRYERTVMLRSETHRLVGKMDLLEIHGKDPARYIPVEYKRGKPKVREWDTIQLCAQALCLEEMRGISIIDGALWYSTTRRREDVLIDGELREKTEGSIKMIHSLMAAGKTPRPTPDKSRCRSCSLADKCDPETFRNDRSASYVREMFSA